VPHEKVHWQRNGQKTDSSGVVLHEYCFVEEGRYYSPRTVVNVNTFVTFEHPILGRNIFVLLSLSPPFCRSDK